MTKPLFAKPFFCAALGAAALALLATAPAQAQTRVPWYQPFDGSAIWNTPIGNGATYTSPVGIGGGTDFSQVDVEYHIRGLSTDPVLSPTGPGQTYPGNIPFPYYALPNRSSGDYPNNCTSYIQTDGSTLWGWQYWSRPSFGSAFGGVNNVQVGLYNYNDILLSSGEPYADKGTHGGSELSTLGGSLRVGEATSADPIRHALKIDIDGHYLYSGTPNFASGDRGGNGYRWPAFQRDGSGSVYSGTNPEVAMGTLLAIPPSVNINNLGLQTAFGKKIAWTLQNFGIYIVDDSGFNGDQVSMEQNVREEINSNYGAPNPNRDFSPSVDSDLLLLFQKLCAVTNNSSSSVGGGGTPLTTNGGPLGNVNNIPDGDYYIKNRNSGEYLNVNGSSTSGGASIIQYAFQSGAQNEIFTLKHIGNGYYTITGKGSGLAVTVNGASTADSAKLEQDGFGTLPAGGTGPADNQLWSFLPVDSGNGDYLIQARHSNEVIDVPGGTSDAVQLQQYQVIDGAPQRWSLVSVSGGTVSPPVITPSGSAPIGQRIAVTANATGNSVFADGNNSQVLEAKSATTPSTWDFYDVVDAGSGLVALKSASSGYYVTCHLDNNDLLIADHATTIQAWEQFTWQDLGSGAFALKSPASGYYVSSDLNDPNDALRAAFATTVQSWETFNYTVQSASPSVRQASNAFRLASFAASAASSPSKSVTITDKTAGATIRYTTDGTTPTASSTVYTAPVSLAANATIKAVGFKTGMTASAVTAYTYTYNFPPAAPTGLAAAAGNAQVSLSWPAVSGATSYSLFRGTAAGGESATAVKTGLTGTSYTDTGLANGTTYFYELKAVNATGTSGYSNEASAKPAAAAPVSVFTSQTPSVTGATDNRTYELGMKFQASVAGKVTALRYWKDAKDTVAHTGHLWSASGTLLATVTFSGGTTSGWQQASLSSAVSVSANTVYVVSVNTGGYFSETSSGLSSAVKNGVLSSVADGSDGVYGNAGSFPTSSYSNTNYFRDVVFQAN